MAEVGEDKTTFFTRKGVFCYQKMSFGLKSAEATYQRLVDKVFNDQIRRNLEVYVDDMMIKSASKKYMLMDIQETFDRLRSINMKLNPKKSNPSKFKAITDLKPSRMLKEIQSLNGKLATLSRFLSKDADRSLPFFKALKSCTDKKSIQCTADAKEAFRKMKEFIEILPTLIAPIKGEVLGVIRGRVKPPKVREAHTSSRLCCQKTAEVFQAHPITVLTDKPFKQILAKPEKLGRIAKWAIELVEHDIEFKGRNSVKGKILADFLVETPSAEDKDTKTKEPEAAKKAPNLEST
ncbi:reverse transcriptase domain-containing protein [Tanacetum coccineum]